MSIEFIEKIAGIAIEFATSMGIRLLGAIILLVAGIKIIKGLLKLLDMTRSFKNIDPGAASFLRSFINIVLKVILGFTIASVLGVPMTSAVALLASAGLAVGLALQGALSNLAGGLMILIFKPFRQGDHIETGSGSGIVKEINTFYTVVRTFDNKIITMPNGSLTNIPITNYSVEEKRRVDFQFTVSYDTDIEKVKKILLDIASGHSMVLDDPAPVTRLKEHGDSSLVFILRTWCNAPDYWTIYFDITEKVKQEFDREKIEIPYPQLDVHMR